MEYMKAFAIKFAIVSVVIYSSFGVFLNASMGNLFWLSLLIAVALFVSGDLLLLRRVGTGWTPILDFGCIYLLLHLSVGLFIQETPAPILASLASAYFIACSEPLFHAYIQERVLETTTEDSIPFELQTEFAEDDSMDTILDQDKHSKHTD